MTFQRLVLLAAACSAAILLGALGFQHLGGMAPCKLCIWQRYPHAAAVLIGLLAAVLGWRWLALGGALSALITSGIGMYHTGVEQKWWEGPTSCTSSSISGMSTDDLLSQIMAAPLVRCDEIPWEMFGLSMASWNAVASLGFAAIWLLAFRARR
jgi:disulfide bond formation protein DsbB